MIGGAESEAVIINPLKASGLVDAGGLERARAFVRDRGGSLADALLRLNVIKEADFLRIFAELYSTRFVKSDKLKTLKLDEALLERVGVRAAERLRMCPIRWDEEKFEMHVVAAVPLASNLEADLRQSSGCRSVQVYVATAGAVFALLRKSFYREDGIFSEVTPNGAGPELPVRYAGSDSGIMEAAPEATKIVSGDDLNQTWQGGPFRLDDTIKPGAVKVPDALLFPPTRKLEENTQNEVKRITITTPTDNVPNLKARELDGKTVMVQLNSSAAAGTTVDTLRKENARYRIAQEFHRRVTQERSPEAMVDQILSVIFELVPAEGAAVWLTTGQLTYKTKDPAKKVEVPRAVIDQTLTSTNGVLVNNALLDERFDRSKSVVLRGIQSIMCVPLRTRNGTLGLLYVESVSQSAAFSQDDLPLFDSIGAQAAMLLDNASLIAQVRREVENRTQLSRFLSAAAVEEVLSGRMSVKMEGQLADVTVLFADIRGFTTMSSHMPAEDVVKFLNAFFAEAVDAVERHGGIVDKFIGDCVMAMWGAPVPKPDDARNAINAALEMAQRARKILVNGRPLDVGIGINSGSCVVGAIGSKNRLDYTAIGSVVNLSARLCGIAEPGATIITADTLMRAGPGVVTEAGEAVILKGIDAPIVPHTVISAAPRPSAPIRLERVAPGVPPPRPLRSR